MTKSYPVILYPVEEGSTKTYSVLIPDFPGCVSQGNSYQEALANARAALDLHIQALIEAGEPLSEPSTVDQIRDESEPEAVYGLAEVALGEIRERALARKSVRINVTFPGELLHRIDEYCERAGLARSKFFQLVAEQFLNICEYAENPADFDRGFREVVETVVRGGSRGAEEDQNLKLAREIMARYELADFRKVRASSMSLFAARPSQLDWFVFMSHVRAAFEVFERLKRGSEEVPALGVRK